MVLVVVVACCGACGSGSGGGGGCCWWWCDVFNYFRHFSLCELRMYLVHLVWVPWLDHPTLLKHLHWAPRQDLSIRHLLRHLHWQLVGTTLDVFTSPQAQHV